jgi:hypothetical protein
VPRGLCEAGLAGGSSPQISEGRGVHPFAHLGFSTAKHKVGASLPFKVRQTAIYDLGYTIASIEPEHEITP